MLYLRSAAVPLLIVGVALIAASCAGDGDAPASPDAVSIIRSYQRVRIEAEGADEIEGKQFRIADDPDASGGKCVEIPVGAGLPEDGNFSRAVYRFTVKASGSYTFWCRNKCFDECGSLAVRLDKVGRPHVEAYMFGGAWWRPPRWRWSPVYTEGTGRPRQFDLAAGEHVLEMLNRSDGPRFDVLLLTDEPGYVPEGLGDP